MFIHVASIKCSILDCVNSVVYDIMWHSFNAGKVLFHRTSCYILRWCHYEVYFNVKQKLRCPLLFSHIHHIEKSKRYWFWCSQHLWGQIVKQWVKLKLITCSLRRSTWLGLCNVITRENEQELELFQSVDIFVLKLNFDRWRVVRKWPTVKAVYVFFQKWPKLRLMTSGITLAHKKCIKAKGVPIVQRPVF